MKKTVNAEEEDHDDKKKKKSKKPTTKTLSPDEIRLQIIKNAIGAGGDDPTIYAADQNETIKDVIQTGLADLDRALTPSLYESGRPAGLPRGFIYEFYGPNSGGKSSLCMRLAAQITQRGGGVLWLDVEGSFINEWAIAQGVDLSKVTMVAAGKHGEYYLEIIDKVAKTGAVELIVVDSVTFCKPYEEMFGDLELDEKKGAVKDSRIGAGAKMMSRMMPRIVGSAKTGNTAVVFINQIRQKVGVFYGCFHEDTPISFADGSNKKIGEVVNKRLTGPVVAYDEKEGRFVDANITNWFDNGDLTEDEKWLTIRSLSSGCNNGLITFTCTENHSILTDNGYVEAKNILPNDSLVSYYDAKVGSNSLLQEALFGCLLGDGSLCLRRENTACICLQNLYQPDYLKWKIGLLEQMDFRQLDYAIDRTRFNSVYTTELALIRHRFYNSDNFVVGSKEYRGIPLDLKLTPLMAAIWYMDDGHFDMEDYHCRSNISIKRLSNLKPEIKSIYAAKIIEMWSEFTEMGKEEFKLSDDFCLFFTAKATKSLHSKISTFVCNEMQYKLYKEFMGKYDPVNIPVRSLERKKFMCKVVSIKDASKRKYRSLRKLDIEVDKKHNYLVGNSERGICVHNSNETTPYGEALKFASSIRLRVSRITDKEGKGIKKNGEEIGIRSNVRIIKSRMGPPCDIIIPIYYDSKTKPHPLDSLIDIGLGNKIIKSRSKKTDDGESIQTFTFEDVSVVGIDDFKNALEYEQIKAIFDRAKALDVPFEADLIQYVEGLGGTADVPDEVEKLLEKAPEGDPGE